jgi:hypothetical protein
MPSVINCVIAPRGGIRDLICFKRFQVPAEACADKLEALPNSIFKAEPSSWRRLPQRCTVALLPGPPVV